MERFITNQQISTYAYYVSCQIQKYKLSQWKALKKPTHKILLI